MSASKDDQKKLFLNYLNKHVFNYWKGKNNTGYCHDLELILTPVCNTKCTYCYYKNYGKELNNPILCSKKNIMDNLDKIGLWFKKEKFISGPDALGCVEIFSGEFFNIPYYSEILQKLEEFLPKQTTVSIPSNGSFALTAEKTKEIEDVIYKYNSDPNSNIRIMLSLSIDGKYSDEITRSFRNSNLKYTDEFYERLFTFAAKFNYGFHPMVCAENIKVWPENFDWFIENIMKYFHVDKKEAYTYIYLLEVRNPNWTTEDNLNLKKFIKHIVQDSFETFEKDKQKYLQEFLRPCTLNFFSTTISTVGRGLGCSIQQSFAVRLSDLTLVPCHRTSYEGYNACKLLIDNEGNLDLDLENPYLYMMINAFNAASGPLCNKCDISELCSHACLGCNFEVNKDFFLPVSTVCTMERSKIEGILEAFNDYGLIDEFLYMISKGNQAIYKVSNKELLKINQIKKIVKNIGENYAK